MALTDLQVRKAMPDAKIYKLSDGGGLQLWITPDGAKRWRVAYRFGGGQKRLASIRQLACARPEMPAMQPGQDPSFAKGLAKAAKVVAAANSFEAVAAELFEKKKREGKGSAHAGKNGMAARHCRTAAWRQADCRNKRGRDPGSSARC